MVRRHRHTLDNGLRVVTLTQPHVHRVSAVVYCRAGSRYESRKTNGLSHFVEHMIFRGTESHPDTTELHYAIESLGGSFHAATHADYTYYEILMPPVSLDEGMSLLGEIIREPRFERLELEKEIVREEIRGDLDEDGRDVNPDNLSREQLWPDHPLGFPIAGPLENLDRFSLEDVRRFFKKHFVGSNLVLCVTGPVSPEEVTRLAARDFAGLPRGEVVVPEPARAAQKNPAYAHVVSDSSQTEMRIAWRAIAETDPRNAAQQLLLRLLDDGMSTPLHREIVDVRGLVYEVSAALDPYQDTGVFDVTAAAQHDKVPDVLELILSMCVGFTRTAADARELAKAKRRYRWELESMVDDLLSLSGWFGAGELFEDPKELSVWADEVDRVTTEQIQALAQAIFTPENLNVLTVGLLGRRDRKKVMALVDRAGQ